ncbi:AMP-binding protein [Afifella pfennigii]|uniref:AMP-binding protein n=1 Tax=Afifella pfennigii TaxID=209897 RepID=UPI00055710DD|nr:AMP-binding protein [Afifella pfennigii]
MTKPFGAVHGTVGDVLRTHAAARGEKTFLAFEGQAYSYAFADSHSDRVANGLRDKAKVGKGTHVGLLLGNCPQFVWSVFGLGKLGAVAVPFNTAVKGELLSYLLEQSKVSVLIVEEDLLPRVAACMSGDGPIRIVIVVPGSKGTAEDIGVSTLPFAAIEDAPDAPVDAGVTYRDPVFLMYTSGTTGPSKGVVAPHSQGLSIGHQLVSVYGYTAEDVLYTCLPLFHANALWYSMMPALICGATLAVSRRFSGSRFWQEIVDCGATQANALGAMANIALKELDRLDRSRLKLRQCMVVPALDEEAGKPFRDMGIKLTSLFAQTETFAVTLHGPDEPAAKAGSAGRAHPYAEVAILDDEDWALPAGEVGEIAVRPSVPGIMMQGYFDMPRETLGVMSSLWFHTGDRGYLDADGYLYFVDRKKDAIRRRGENISAYELEMIVSRHPALREAAAVAVPSELGEDDVLVCLVANAGARIDFAEIIAFCDANMPYFMVPRYLHLLDALPKTAPEKIEKYKLRAWAAENMCRLWDREKAGIKVTR